MRRAVSEAEKEEKANIILDKAIELYLTQSYNSVKMIDIARACGFSKGIIFFYFNTKERLFLEILNREYQKRFDYLIGELQKVDRLSFDDLISFILDEMQRILDEKSPFIRLTAIMSSTLEENIDYETAVDFKQRFYLNGYRISELIAERVSNINFEDCMKLFMAQQAIIVGYKNMSNSPGAIKQAVQKNQMNAFKIDFKTSALQAMRYYLEGLKNECLGRSIK